MTEPVHPAGEPGPADPPVPNVTETLAFLEKWLADFIDARLQTLVNEAFSDEGKLWLQFTAWANGWIKQIEGAGPGIISQGLKGFKLFTTLNPAEPEHEVE
jgi:hypothetical protein